MPTGYTADVLDGKIKTFSEFAKTCMRAFGACIHMRDDSMDKPYEPQVPSNYHSKRLQEAKEALEKAKTISDEEIILALKERGEESNKYHLDAIAKIKSHSDRILSMIAEVKTWVPPTEEHVHFKEFMLQQLTDTYKWDCDTKYHDEALNEIAEDEDIDVNAIRAEMIADAEHNIEYHTKEYKEEVERCNDANKWVEVLLKSIK